MTYRIEWWCDECGKQMSRVEVQWSGCHANRYHTRDFCGYPCAEEFKRKATEHQEHGRGTTLDGPDDPDCPCRGTDKTRECANVGCGFCIAERYK